MPEYDSLAVLRRALTDDDPDRRANAYGDVMELDVEVSKVLDAQPDEEVVQTLRDGDVLPEAAQTGMPAPEYRRQVLALLDTIASNTGGDS